MVLRIDETTHHRVNSTTPLEQYTTNDEIVSSTIILSLFFLTYFQVYEARISRYDTKTSVWTPYSGLKDLQLEFTMLDPHIRTALLPVKGQPGKYSVTFRAPDRHGVFKFVINYKRKGYVSTYDSCSSKLIRHWVV